MKKRVPGATLGVMETAEKKEREINIRIAIGRREFIAAAAFLILAASALDLSTESLTLTTYYPAPYGAYKELRATRDAYLAYVPGGATPQVLINTDTKPGAVDPLKDIPLVVKGDAAANILFDSQNTNYYLDPDASGSGGSGKMKGPFTAEDSVVVGPAGPRKRRVDVQNGYVRLYDTGCRALPIGVTKTSCSNTEYATMLPGVYQEGRYDLASFDLASVVEKIISGTEGTTTAEVTVQAKGQFYCCPK